MARGASSSKTDKGKEPIPQNQPAESLDLTSVNDLLTQIMHNQQKQERSLNESLNEINSRQARVESELSNLMSAAHGNSSPEVASVPPTTSTPEYRPGDSFQPNLSRPPDLSSTFNKQTRTVQEVEAEIKSRGHGNFTADVNREPQINPASGDGFRHQPYHYPYAAPTGNQIPPPVNTFSTRNQPPGFDTSTPRQRMAQMRGINEDFGSFTLNPGLNPGLNQGSWNLSQPGNSFGNGFSTQPPFPEGPPPMRRMNSQLPRQHERETQVPPSPILSAKEIVGLETQSEPSTVDKFETPIGEPPFSKLNQSEQKLVLENHKQALNYVMQTDFTHQHHLSRFVENFTFDKTVQQKDLEAIDFLYRLRNWYKQFIRRFNPKYTYMNEKYLMTFVLDKVFRQPQVANEGNGAYTWFNSRILAGIKDTMDSFVNDFRLKFVSSRIKEHCENFIKDTEFNPNENMDTFFAKINYATQLYFYGTGEACPDEAVSIMIRNSISRGSEDLYRQLCTMFQGSIDGIDFKSLTAALQRLEKSQESQQAENEARSNSRIRSQTIHLGGPSIKTKPRTNASFRHYDGASPTVQTIPAMQTQSSDSQYFSFNTRQPTGRLLASPTVTFEEPLDSIPASGYSIPNVFTLLSNECDKFACEQCGNTSECQCVELSQTENDQFFTSQDPERREAELAEDLEDISLSTDKLYLATHSEDSNMFFVKDSEGNIMSTAKFKCRKCGKDHFMRDCPELGGTGRSQIGQKFGSAKGFKEGETPPDGFIEARKRNLRRRRAIILAKNNVTAKRMNRAGTQQTHARQLKRVDASNPPKHQYQILAGNQLVPVGNTDSKNADERYLSFFARLAEIDQTNFH